jgi:mono/diheme cytochrome c family protein
MALLAVALTLSSSACDLSMARQHRAAPERGGDLWPGGPPVQPPPAGTAPVTFRPGDEAAPPPMSLALLERGRQRFDIYCLPCHGERGHADGQVVRRGFPAPPSFDDPRLVASPISHFYDVATDGYGVMFGYGDRVPASDRWAIAAYVRVLQLADRPAAASFPSGGRGTTRSVANGGGPPPPAASRPPSRSKGRKE